MADIAITWDTTNFRGDWTIGAGDLGVDPGGIESAVLVSLFTDRVASDDYTPPPGEPFDRRGWWGDTYEPSPIGSRLWQLNRSKKTDNNGLLLKARDYAREALQWLVDGGIAASVNVETWWLQPTALALRVTLVEPKVPGKNTFSFVWAWDGVFGDGTLVPPAYINDADFTNPLRSGYIALLSGF